MTPDIRIVDDAAALAQAAAQMIVGAAQSASGPWSIALSGGSTPKAIYGLLAQPPLRDQMPWDRTHLFWGDERHVPPDDPDSNYRMARTALLDHVPLPPANIHRIAAELPVAEAAATYDIELHHFFPNTALPHFDLVLLGLGDDGHTASLFPHTAALHETERWVVANHVPTLNTDRITLTASVINNARQVVFLVAGAAKVDAVTRVLHGPHDPETLPAQLIAPTNGQLVWLLDRAAARNV